MDVPTSPRQRLVAILAADAVGYSRLMARDSHTTLIALDAARAIFRTRIEAHAGRVIDMAGDSVLAAFDTAIGAVDAALAAQEDLRAVMQGPAETWMRFRVGVHLGDVIEKADGTVYGDGVNIAARLEGLADPGGILVSDSIRNAVKGRNAARFVDLGERTVKNIAEPIRVYRVSTNDAAAEQGSSPVDVLGSAAAAGGALGSGSTVADAARISLALPERPSIAVLPFVNMSGDAAQVHFTDGITEDIITELSRFRSLFVIARSSMFTYKGRAVDVRVISDELGVRYVLEGSIRRSADRIRVTAQLIDASNGVHLWAEKYDRVLEDIFAVQEELTLSIVAALVPHIDLSEAERARKARPGNLGAYALAVRGMTAARTAFATADKALMDEALRFGREALAIDPRSALALRTIAFAQWQHVHFNTGVPVAETIREGIDAARQAIAIDGSDHEAHLWRGNLLLLSGQSAAGKADIEHAYELNPNDAVTLSIAGLVASDPQTGIRYAMQALRLSPRDPARFVLLSLIAWAYFSAADYDSSCAWAHRSIVEQPGQPGPHLCLTLCLVALGDLDQAQREFVTWKALAPGLAAVRLNGQWQTADREFGERATRFLRIAAGLDGAATPGSQQA